MSRTSLSLALNAVLALVVLVAVIYRTNSQNNLSAGVNARASMRTGRMRALVNGMPKLPQRAVQTRSSVELTTCVDLKDCKYSDPDQQRRFAKHKSDNNQRVLDIDSVYDPSSLKGKVVMVTGANRGLGNAIAKELAAVGAKIIAANRSPGMELEGDLKEATLKVIDGIDVSNDASMEKLIKDLGDQKVDVLINNAGYFLKDPETIDNLNFPEELKMIDICALGPLRVASALVNAGLMESGGKIVTISSQGGSIAWREVQNQGGPYDYGHHMSKCAANMMTRLLAMELKEKGITVVALHPGFNRTKMTEKYKHIWDIEGAVDPSVGAKRVVHETATVKPDRSGVFINCEDGLEIPW
mmetsp:Transcript_10605/g.20763  ORF Transcript_10605/g.20763 Transcript_10605/m.20763 type:complete len:356 (-) Transcript_10605:304-1371(-)